MSDVDEPACDVCGHPARGRLVEYDEPGDKLIAPGEWETVTRRLCRVCYGGVTGNLVREAFRNLRSPDTQDMLKAISYAANEVIDAIERQAKP